jgi:hypothetical protein
MAARAAAAMLPWFGLHASVRVLVTWVGVRAMQQPTLLHSSSSSGRDHDGTSSAAGAGSKPHGGGCQLSGQLRQCCFALSACAMDKLICSVCAVVSYALVI